MMGLFLFFKLKKPSLGGGIGWDMAEPPSLSLPGTVKDNRLLKGVFAVSGIMSTLVIYGVLQVWSLFVFTV